MWTQLPAQNNKIKTLREIFRITTVDQNFHICFHILKKLQGN